MTLTTQLGSPISARRAVWASAAGILGFALLKGSGKSLFESVMIGAFVSGFTSCIPLTLGPVDSTRP